MLSSPYSELFLCGPGAPFHTPAMRELARCCRFREASCWRTRWVAPWAKLIDDVWDIAPQPATAHKKCAGTLVAATCVARAWHIVGVAALAVAALLAPQPDLHRAVLWRATRRAEASRWPPASSFGWLWEMVQVHGMQRVASSRMDGAPGGLVLQWPRRPGRSPSRLERHA